MLEIQKLTRTQGARRLPHAADLRVEAGEIVAVLGDTASGKSSLLRCIAGLDTPESGDIRLDGAPLRATPPHLRPVAFVAQGAALWPQMTVRANLAFAPESRGLPAAEVRARVDAALSGFDITALADRRPSTLSGGELQRVALARALAQAPRVLLLDEPFAWTGDDDRDALLTRLREHLRETGACAILATRDPHTASLADRIAVIQDGCIVQTGPFEEVHRRPVSAGVARLTGPANLIPARILRCGAGEFIAESELGELHGALGNPDREPAEGATITVLMRPEHLRVSDMPPDENVFAGTWSAEPGRNRLSAVFQTETGPALRLDPPTHRVDDDSVLYAWILPEDLVALG